ncbi:MAG: DNA-directed RNA polymerase [Myxococcales bacterium]|nr:DNA-directed RNA polymerase [Myxococcales bacterium]
MDRRALLLAFSAAALCLATGCASYVPVTQELRNEHHLSANDLSNLQFYNSDTITLRRELERGDREVTGAHKLRVIAGKQIEEVVIAEHTPGVIVGVSEGLLRVSFEEGTFLEFGVSGPEPISEPLVARGGFAEPPDPFPADTRRDPRELRPFLTGSGNYWLLTDGGAVTFQGKRYEAVGATTRAHLVISTESLDEVEEEKTVLKGRRL